MAVMSNQFQEMGAKYGLPSSEKGVLNTQSATADTSNIFIGNSEEKATRWRVQRGAGTTPNAALAGRGDVLSGDKAAYQPVEAR